MDWLNIHTSTLDSVEFLSAKPVQRSTWLCLSRYCVGQENGGIIAGCESWDDRRWQQICRVTKREVSENCDLWKWENGSLVVWEYPVEKEKEVMANRENGKRGGRPKKNQVVNHTVNPSETTRHEIAETEQEGKGIGKERKGKGSQPAGSAEPATPSLGRPADLPEVIAYFASKGAPEIEAGKFFDHYEANGWKQGGRAVIRSWRSAANNWIRRWQDGGLRGEKNPATGGARRGGAAVVPFDPTKPHAHTGGLADAAGGDV